MENICFRGNLTSSLLVYLYFSLMFWTNWNEQKPSIMRSTLAGKNMRIIISSDILTPNGLTLDHKAEKLYFSDGSLGKIERCDYDGSSRYVSSKRKDAHCKSSQLWSNFLQTFFFSEFQFYFLHLSSLNKFSL